MGFAVQAVKKIQIERVAYWKKEQRASRLIYFFKPRLQLKMQSAGDIDENKATTGTRLPIETGNSTEKKRRSRDITELKAEAENLKVSLSSLTSESEKALVKERTAYFDDMFQLLGTTNVNMDRKVLENIVELLKLDVHPDSILELLRTVMVRKEENEVIFI